MELKNTEKQEHSVVALTIEITKACLLYTSETLGCKLMELLAEQAPQTIIDRYSIAIPEEECDFLGYELLQQAGRRRGFLLRGGEIDTERMALSLIHI